MPLDFKNINTTKASMGGNYIRPGNYLCRIDRVKQGESQTNGAFIAIEMTVFHVFDGAHAVGENVTHMLMSKHLSWLANFKAAVMGITGCSEEEVTEEAANAIVSDDQPLSGDVVRVSAWNVITQKNKAEFTKVKYEEPIPEEKWRPLLSEEDLQAIGID